MSNQNEKSQVFKPWVNEYPAVHPCTSQEQILERIATAIEAVAKNQAITNERLCSIVERLAEPTSAETKGVAIVPNATGTTQATIGTPG